MGNGQRTKTGKGSELRGDTSATLPKSRLVAASVKPASVTSSSLGTSATTQNVTPKTVKIADVEKLQSKLSIVAGALADYQAASGRVVSREKSVTLPSGSTAHALIVYLVADGYRIIRNQTIDGMEFCLVAEKEGK